jgi:nucleoside-diphosphate-sugar epimerase
MRVLIIGGTGLISAYISQILAERGQDEVVLYNRGQSIYPAPPGVKSVTGDRTDYSAFENQVSALGRFDAVIDMVAYRPADGESVLHAFSGRVGQFIFCSTVDIYRKPASRYPYTEAEEYGGLNDYASNKVVLEKMFFAACAKGNFPLTVIRPAYTYGEGRAPLETFGGRSQVLDRIRRGLPIVVHGDGSSLWVACHASDVARAFVNALGAPAAAGKAYHTAGEEWLTWNDYYRRIAAALSAPDPTLVHIPTDLLQRWAPRRAGLAYTNIQFNNIFDNTAARRDLGFAYTIDWQSGVRRMAAWLDERGQVERAESDPFDDRLIAAWERCGSSLTAEELA